MNHEEEDELEITPNISPLRLALSYKDLKAKVLRLEEINENINKTAFELKITVEHQAAEIDALKAFRAEIKTGAKLLAWLGGTTLAILTVVGAFVSGLGNSVSKVLGH